MDKELSTTLLRQHVLSNLHIGRSPIRGLVLFLPSGQEGMKCANAMTDTCTLQRMNRLPIGYR